MVLTLGQVLYLFRSETFDTPAHGHHGGVTTHACDIGARVTVYHVGDLFQIDVGRQLHLKAAVAMTTRTQYNSSGRVREEGEEPSTLL